MLTLFSFLKRKILTLFILHLNFYSFFIYLEDERKKKVMMVFQWERKRKNFKKKLTKISILNKIFCKIDNLILKFLKSE